ncbi:uncharacterized protein LOC142356763, partial [Convolutriloba macropyga]|uniref:uncharacterized protein LOC142356763 n=1 Tax=Convolutriloba macropyga TaxID=536237 RepID=UPI003F51D830
MTTVGYGDISPTNLGEIFVGMAVMLGGIMTFVILIGSIQDVVSDSSDDSVRLLNAKLPAVHRWADEENVSDDVKQQITRYYQEVWAHGNSDVGPEMFTELPHQLQAAAARDAVGPLLSSVAVFKDLDDEQRAHLASKMKPVSVGTGENVISAGDPAEFLW